VEIEVKPDGTYWTLYVNGEPTIRRETFTICDRVRESLQFPGTNWPSEAEEVATSIQKHYGS
jgi:hypothetical protein